MKTKGIKSSIGRMEALAIAKECGHLLKERFGVREVYLFGSVIGEAPWHNSSDLDIAVEGLAPGDYFNALSSLGEIVPPELEVDLFTLENARPELAAKIRGEKKKPEDPIEAMKERIASELRSLQRVVQGLQTFLNTAPDHPSEIEERGVASYLHDFYTGVERTFERISVTLDSGLPTGEQWHQLLLQQMKEERKGVRPPVIDNMLHQHLLQYLRFRHRFRHTYGNQLVWDELRPLAEQAQETFTRLRAQLELARYVPDEEQSIG